jgi:hypothetical protein
MTQMELTIPDNLIRDETKKAVLEYGLVPKRLMLGRQIKIDEFRKKYCRGKAPAWVRHFIFDAFPETNFKNGGWVVHPRSRPGHHDTTWIYEYQASQWMDEHKFDIDWDAKLPS